MSLVIFHVLLVEALGLHHAPSVLLDIIFLQEPVLKLSELALLVLVEKEKMLMLLISPELHPPLPMMLVTVNVQLQATVALALLLNQRNA